MNAAGTQKKLARSCACDGKCGGCERDKSRLQRSPSSMQPAQGDAPPIVHAVLRSPGEPLDAATRMSMEPRFGHNFSRVRVHHDAAAATSAREVDARAYTVGPHIVFGAGRYAPSTAAGMRLLAHELAHAVQQSDGAHSVAASPLEIGSSRDASETEADAAADAAMAGKPARALGGSAMRVARVLESSMPKQPPPSSLTPVPAISAAKLDPTIQQTRGSAGPHGTNPSTCMAPVCTALRSANPRDEAGVLAQGQFFRTKASDCLTSTGPSSGARHSAAIVKNDVDEVNSETSDIDQQISSADNARGRAIAVSTYMENLRALCARKQREIDIEFKYNVILENTAIRQWGSSDPNEMNQLDTALGEAPREATWDNQVEVHLRRDRCYLAKPGDIDTCMSGVGGQTSSSRGQKTATIDIYDAGIGAKSYPRSAQRAIPSTTQSVVHELGHLTEDQVPEAARNDLRDRILDWHEWADESITAIPGLGAQPSPARQEAMRLAGFAGNDALFDGFLRTLSDDMQKLQNNRTWNRMVSDPATKSHTYLTWRGIVPQVKEYEYARTGFVDYFAESYMFAVTRPEWLIRTLAGEQITWWRENVFHIPSTPEAWKKELAGMQPPPTSDEIAGLLSRTMTRDHGEREVKALRDTRARDGSAGRGAATSRLLGNEAWR